MRFGKPVLAVLPEAPFVAPPVFAFATAKPPKSVQAVILFVWGGGLHMMGDATLIKFPSGVLRCCVDKGHIGNKNGP